MTDDGLLVRALDACIAWNALGCDVDDRPLARFARSDRFPHVPAANRISHVRASSPREIDDLLAQVDRAFSGVPSVTFDLDHRTPPPFGARLALEGCDRRDNLVMLLESDIRALPPPCDITLVENDATWSAWEELSIADNLGYPVHPGVAADRDDAMALAATRRAKCPPVRYWLSYVEGEPAGFFSAWEGVDGVGVTENLSVREAFRRRGVATALMHRCVADARERGAGPIALTCNPHDWPKGWYARLGFTPIAVKRTYTREALASEAPPLPTSNI